MGVALIEKNEVAYCHPHWTQHSTSSQARNFVIAATETSSDQWTNSNPSSNLSLHQTPTRDFQQSNELQDILAILWPL